LLILPSLPAREHGHEVIPRRWFLTDDIPAFECVRDSFNEERYLGRLPFSREVVVSLVAIVLRLGERLRDVVEMILNPKFLGLRGGIVDKSMAWRESRVGLLPTNAEFRVEE
jgi:hypothetical protein